jgi:signal transduction histidine kinase
MTTIEPEASSRWQRLLLPGSLLGAPPGRRSARDWIVDATMFLLAVATGALSLSSNWSYHSPATRGVDLIVGTMACAALWLRRTRPIAVGWFTIAAGSFFALAGGAALFGLFNAAIRVPRRTLVAMTAVGLLGAIVYSSLYRGTQPYDWGGLIVGVLLTVVAIGWGLFVRAQRDLMIYLRERAERLESEQRLSIELAQQAERQRIAREMHDVLAHRLSLLSVHAGALEFRSDATPEEVAEAASVIRASAHAALQELRDVIGLLREESDESEPQPPQPTFAQIPSLVEESRAAGMNVHLDDDGVDGAPISVALGRTAYRIIQEGLTNARKHAPAAAVEVSISAEPDALLVGVVSRPAVGVPAAPRLAEAGTGTGLIGLAERVALAGGELKFGPDENGDFVIRARLPRQP